MDPHPLASYPAAALLSQPQCEVQIVSCGKVSILLRECAQPRSLMATVSILDVIRDEEFAVRVEGTESPRSDIERVTQLPQVIPRALH